MRVRITFSKSGAMQYVGHIDLHRVWERTFRRAGLPLAYSQGFHPQPRLNLACALPVGFTSQAELLDTWLEQELPLERVQSALLAALPPGLELIGLGLVDDHTPALQTQVASSVYKITFLDDIPDLDERISRLLSAEHLPRVRRDKPYDLRPLIESITILARPDEQHESIRVQMSAHENATGRPEELLEELGVRYENTHVQRERLLLVTD